MVEIFKPIPEYPNYEVSNLGRVKSLRFGKERILKPSSSTGYLIVTLCNEIKRKSFLVHQLIAMTFLNHIPNGHKLVIDHVDNDKTNNHLSNLRIVTNRFNTSRHTGGTSKYSGVYWNKDCKKWVSQITIKGKRKHLGYFENEYDAYLEYKKRIKLIKN